MEYALSNEPSELPWKFAWLTPMRCRMIFVLVMSISVFWHVRYLQNQCPIDLSGDEAQYWDWSRKLDLSYYSKGPLVAYIIRGSCAIFGETMPAVRYPAIVLAVGTSLCTYWLSRKLFRSDRLALGTVLLCGIVPMFMAGSLLMTIDAPFYFCWALATCLGAKAVFDESQWAWPVLGLIVGSGFLAKYAMLLWLPGLLLFLALDETSRKFLRRPGLWLMILIALLGTTPVWVWNAQHDWVTLRHVGTQTGATGENHFNLMNVLSFLGAQVGILNPLVFVCMVGGIVYAFRMIREEKRGTGFQPVSQEEKHGLETCATKFLLVIGGFFFLVTMLSALRAKPQPNWPAPAYFTLIILTGYFLSTRLHSRRLWNPWRNWVYAGIVFGIVVTPLIHDPTVFYAFVRFVNRQDWSIKLRPGAVDFAYKLRGNADLATHIAGLLKPGDVVFCEEYQNTALMAFYLPGQPRTYCIGSWTGQRRWSQYDIWPDCQLDRAELIGKDAIYVGQPSLELVASFARWEKLPEFDIVRGQLTLRRMPLYRGFGFKGMHRPVGRPEF